VSVSEEEMKEHLARAEDGRSSLVFDPKEHSFSPTSLDAYDECPKKYELKHLYGLPERGAYDGEPGRADMGSFIHKVLEEASTPDTRQRRNTSITRTGCSPTPNGTASTGKTRTT